MVDTNDDLSEMLDPVWFNTVKVRSLIDTYEAIAKHSSEINKSGKGKFFGFVQNSSLELAVITLCKIYDKSNNRYQKNTAPELVKYICGHSSFRDKIGIEGILDKLEKFPSTENDSSLEKLFLFRNKVFTHQEDLEEDVKKELKFLPSIEEMRRLNIWAFDVCQLFSESFRNVTLSNRVKSQYMATSSVIAKVLDKNFDDLNQTYSENIDSMKEFYKRDS